MLLLRVLAITALLTVAPGFAQDLPFSDVSAEDPYASGIQMLVEMGVIAGYPDGTFRGEKPVTRYELTVVVARMMKYFEQSLPAGTALTPPTDISREIIRGIDRAAAAEYLRAESVQFPATMLDKPQQPATMEEVVSVMTSAMARLIERATPAAE